MRLTLLLALAACSKQPAGADACKPLTITVDGTALPPLGHGLAKAKNMNGDVTYEVELFNHDKATCEQLLSKTGREIPDGEISVRAFAGGAGMTGHGVGIESHTQMGGSASLASAKPKAGGDVVQICVDHIAFKPLSGAYRDKQVVVDGLFTGTYCGEQTW